MAIRNLSASFTRPADTTAYASGDLVANSTTAGSVTPLDFTPMGKTSNGSSIVRRVKLQKSGTSTANASFRVHLYSSSPTCTNGDNGAWLTTGAAGYAGSFDVTVDRAFSDGAVGFGVPVVGSEVLARLNTLSIYGLVEARGAYTPTSAEVFTLYVDMLDD